MKKFNLLICLLCWICKSHAYSLVLPFDCHVLNGADFIDYTPTLLVNPNLADGSELGSQVILNANIECPNGSLFIFALSQDSTTSDPTVLTTGIPGLGVRLHVAFNGYYRDQEGEHFYHQAECSDEMRMGDLHSGAAVHCMMPQSQVRMAIVVTATLVKIAKDLNNYTDSAMEYTVHNDAHIAIDGIVTSFLDYPIIRVHFLVQQPTCTLVQHNYDINLPAINADQLANVGATAGEHDFRIDLTQCRVNTKITANFHDLNAGGSNKYGILGNSGTAKGIGVQLLYKIAGVPAYQPLMLDGDVYITTATDNQLTPLLFRARYYRIADSQLSGTVSSLANFTLAYE